MSRVFAGALLLASVNFALQSCEAIRVRRDEGTGFASYLHNDAVDQKDENLFSDHQPPSVTEGGYDVLHDGHDIDSNPEQFPSRTNLHKLLYPSNLDVGERIVVAKFVDTYGQTYAAALKKANVGKHGSYTTFVGNGSSIPFEFYRWNKRERLGEAVGHISWTYDVDKESRLPIHVAFRGMRVNDKWQRLGLARPMLSVFFDYALDLGVQREVDNGTLAVKLPLSYRKGFWIGTLLLKKPLMNYILQTKFGFQPASGRNHTVYILKADRRDILPPEYEGESPETTFVVASSQKGELSQKLIDSQKLKCLEQSVYEEDPTAFHEVMVDTTFFANLEDLQQHVSVFILGLQRNGPFWKAFAQ